MFRDEAQGVEVRKLKSNSPWEVGGLSPDSYTRLSFHSIPLQGEGVLSHTQKHTQPSLPSSWNLRTTLIRRIST